MPLNVLRDVATQYKSLVNERDYGSMRRQNLIATVTVNAFIGSHSFRRLNFHLACATYYGADDFSFYGLRVLEMMV